MRIKALELTGFKSFPNRTVLQVPAGVTGIVGPNGCGKSNIVDAIRWVLGEQSPKHLRGEAMEDVIFNGNERTSPLGMAEVSLTMENDAPPPPFSELDAELSDLPSHFRGLSEIMVTRRYFRSGESEYYINKIPCRLKDITELFLGTGIGSKAYSTIEQGRVEQLINAKPEDRRLFIEEAAGTTLYRSRKLAAERKMERARENLARVNDVLGEIDRQVGYLQRQAKKAETYRRLSSEIQELDLRLSGGQWRALLWQQLEQEEALAAVERLESDLRAALGGLEEAQHAAAAALSEAEREQASIKESVAVLEAERQSARERVAMLDQEAKERERRRDRLSEELSTTESGRAAAEANLARVERERDESAQALLFEEGGLDGGERELESARRQLAAAQDELETAKSALVDLITRELEARNGRTALERRQEELARRIDKLGAEESELAGRAADIEEQLERRRAEITALRARLDATSDAKESVVGRVRALAEARRRSDREAAEIEAAVMQRRSRLESLEQIQRNYEGFHRGVRAIMREESHPDGVFGVVADVIDIPQQYERAVAAVLGERLQYVIVRGESDGAGAVDRLRREASGRGSFIPLHPRMVNGNDAASLNGTSKRLLDLVRVDSGYQSVAEALLGEVVLVPDLDSAVAIWRKNGIHVTLVTPEGDVVDPAGVITGGSDHPIEEEILARRREMDGLRAGLDAASSDLAAVRMAQEQVEREIEEAEAQLRALGDDVHALTLEIVAAEKDVERLELERPQCGSRSEVVRYEIESLRAEQAGLTDERGGLDERLASLGAERLRLEQRVSEQRSGLDGATQHLESVNTQVTAMKVRVAERRERQQAAAAAVESWRRQLGELVTRAGALAAEIEATEVERREIATSIASLREREAEQAGRRSELEIEIGAAAERVERAGEGVRAAEAATRATHAELDEARDARSRIEVARSELRLRTEHLSEAVRERYGAEIAEREVEELQAEDLEEGPARLANLKERIARLGEVNVGAIDELRELEERGGDLRTQRDDLERSLADLERTIQKLNRASRTRFAETFARANETFQKVFPRLFRGGEGKLVLTNEDDLLESGVEIVVRPPGKRLETVALLSGGEKALVAVSLIFSLYLINPTPFCILDEVDAPLDDANIGRFGQMIGEMSQHSQFILITHNKRTMEAASVLYGVTMQEPGVSKVISVAMH